MPDLPIVDTHVHLWDPAQLRYDWLTGHALLNQRHLLEEYRQATQYVEVEHMVFLECGAAAELNIDEIDFVAKLAEQDPRITGMVAACQVEKGSEAIQPIAALAAREPRLKGVRRLTQGEGNAAFCLQDAFIQGVRQLDAIGLHFELCIKGDGQIEAATKFAQQCPNVPIMLDHIGKPPIGEGRTEPWATHLRELAALDHVVCKMSGLVTEANKDNWTPNDLQPYVHTVLDAFGPDRVMFGSDWPVCRLAGEYQDWVNALDQLTAALSADEQRKLWRDNAVAFYRLV